MSQFSTNKKKNRIKQQGIRKWEISDFSTQSSSQHTEPMKFTTYKVRVKFWKREQIFLLFQGVTQSHASWSKSTTREWQGWIAPSHMRAQLHNWLCQLLRESALKQRTPEGHWTLLRLVGKILWTEFNIYCTLSSNHHVTQINDNRPLTSIIGGPGPKQVNLYDTWYKF